MIKYFLPLLMLSLNIGALLHPEGDATLNQTHIRFEWEQIPGVDYYALYLSEDDHSAKKLMIFSFIYLPLLQVSFILDKYYLINF